MSTILLIEDEILILDTTKELLELLDHKVYAANSGARAIDILAEYKGQIDLVLLDLSLHDMDGSKLLPMLTEQYPNLKFIICSGSLPDELDFNNKPAVKGILNKPFELKELRDIVDMALNH